MCWLTLYSVLEKANTSVTGGDSIKGRVVELRSLPPFFFFFTTVADTRKGANKALHPLATFTIEGKAGGERQAFYNWNECEWQLLSSCRHSSCLQPRRKIGTGMYPSVLCDRAVCNGYNTQPDFDGNSRANLDAFLDARAALDWLRSLGAYWEGFRRNNFSLPPSSPSATTVCSAQFLTKAEYHHTNNAFDGVVGIIGTAASNQRSQRCDPLQVSYKWRSQDGTISIPTLFIRQYRKSAC